MIRIHFLLLNFNAKTLFKICKCKIKFLKINHIHVPVLARQNEEYTFFSSKHLIHMYFFIKTPYTHVFLHQNTLYTCISSSKHLIHMYFFIKTPYTHVFLHQNTLYTCISSSKHLIHMYFFILFTF